MGLENGYKFDQEPVFRSSEGKEVIPGSEKVTPKIEETVPPNIGKQEGKSTPENTEKLDLVLARLAVATSEQQMQEILTEYNQQFKSSNDFDKAMLESKVGEVKIGERSYNILQSVGGVNGLEARPIEKEYTEAEIASAWEKIKEDKQLRGILAYLVRDDFNSRDSLNLGDVKKFYEKFSTDEKVYMQNPKIGILLQEIKAQNSQQKFNEYNVSAMKFADILFPEE